MPGLDASSAGLLIRALNRQGSLKGAKYDAIGSAVGQGSDALVRAMEKRQDQDARKALYAERDASREKSILATEDRAAKRQVARDAVIDKRTDDKNQLAAEREQGDRQAAMDFFSSTGPQAPPMLGPLAPPTPGSIGSSLGDTFGPALAPSAGTPLPPVGVIQQAYRAQEAERKRNADIEQARIEQTQEFQEKQQEAALFAPVSSATGEMVPPSSNEFFARSQGIYGRPPGPDELDKFQKMQTARLKMLKERISLAQEQRGDVKIIGEDGREYRPGDPGYDGTRRGIEQNAEDAINPPPKDAPTPAGRRRVLDTEITAATREYNALRSLKGLAPDSKEYRAAVIDLGMYNLTTDQVEAKFQTAETRMHLAMYKRNEHAKANGEQIPHPEID